MLLAKKLNKGAGSPIVPADAQFNYVTMLLHGDGTNGAQNNTFLDSSTNNFTITRNGNTTQGSFSPYGSNWSNYFSSGNWLDSSANSAFSFTGNFTVECWVYQTERGNNGVATEIGLYTDGVMIRLGTIGGIYDTVYVNNVNIGGISTYVPLNSWNHIAVVRSGTSITVYVNGTSRATGTFSGTVNGAVGGTRIGAPLHTTGTDQPFSGYISNFRIVKGTAVYTTAFTPSTTNLTAITNTSFLTCQSNRFVDNSASPKTITVNGNTSVQRFNPFGTSTAYSTSVIGGSGYFDGSGDYLSLANNSNLDLGAGDFTLEVWIYRLNTSGANIIWSQWNNNGDNASQLLTNGSSFIFRIGATQWSFGSYSANSWNHVAVTRSGSTVTMFVNGVVSSTQTNSTDVTTTSQTVLGANDLGATPANFFSGYMAGFRQVKGTAVYTSAFTPPTAPPTAITNTKLLTNFTNGAIFDNSMMNDLETVGNAQISTSVKKYGTGSLAFDGTGDWLVAPSNAMFNMGTGNFTIECWAYPQTQVQTYPALFNLTGTADLSVAYDHGDGTNDSFSMLLGSTRTSASVTSSVNAWYHIALVRNGTTVTLYIDGTSRATTTNSSTLGGTTCTIGVYATASPTTAFKGYIDDLRITKGVARYTTTFTPPTSALSDTGPY